MGAVVCLLVGLQNSETSWSSASTIAPLVVALVLFAAGQSDALMQCVWLLIMLL